MQCSQGGGDFVDEIESLTERKMRAMSARARNPIRIQQLETTMRQLIAKKYEKDREWKSEQNSNRMLTPYVYI